VDLNTLLIAPSSFPAPYDALVLPQQAISQAAPDLSGIPAGAEVSPAGCKPADQDFGPTGTAMIVGTDNDSRSTISIELTAVDEPLSARKEQLEQCGEVTATKSGATSTVTSTLTPAPPIDADDTLAVRQTVASGAGGDAVTQSMLTLMAQIDGVRVSAATLQSGFIIAINPDILKDPEAAFEKISPIIPIEKESFLSKATKKGDPYEEIAIHVEQKKGEEILALKIPGLSAYKEKWRFYPGGSAAAGTIGILGYKGAICR